MSISSLGVVTIFLLIGVTMTTEANDFKTVHSFCFEQNHISEQEFIDLRMDATDIDQKFKCFAHCLADKMGYLDEAGKISVQKLESDEGLAEGELSLVVKCKAMHDIEDDPCEYSFQMMACIIRLRAQGVTTF